MTFLKMNVAFHEQLPQLCLLSEVTSDALGERGGLVVNASDSGSRGRGFEPHSGQTVLCP